MTPPPTLILIAGGPGAGKTALGRELARRLPSVVLLDKDVIGGPWVDALLARYNDGHVDRDCALYWDFLRPLEYSAMLAAARDNLALGKSVVAVAPFGPELGDAAWMRRIEASLDEQGARLRAMWIETDLPTARARMQARGESRDDWKLAHWDEFSAAARFAPPREDLFVLHNTGRALPDLVNQALEFLRTP